MTLRTFLYIVIIGLFIVPANAQKNEQNTHKKESVQHVKKKKEKKTSVKHAYDKKHTDQEDTHKSHDDEYNKKNKKSKKGKGHAYGKNKNGLEGKEFGQERARQAKLKHKRRKLKLKETVIVTERKLPTLRERVQNARILLEKQKPTLSVSVYETKRLKLVAAEEKMTHLEKTIQLAKTFEKN